MTRRHATQREVLEAITARLISTIDRYNPDTCFVLDQPIPIELPLGKDCCTVSPGSGSFPDHMFAGGGSMTTTEDATVVVTPLVRHVRDKPRTGDVKLLSAEDGLLTRKWQILRALLADDYDLSLIDGQEERFLLREQLSPRSSQAPGEVTIGKYRMLGLSLTFATPFDWILPPI